MPRKGENIRKRSDGRWEARVPIGKNAEGKTKYKSLFAHSYKEVKEKKKQFLIEQEKHKDLAPGPPLTFEDVATHWLDIVGANVKSTSFVNYQNLLDYHVLPYLGPVFIEEVDAGAVSNMLMQNSKHGNKNSGGTLSPQTLQCISTVTKRVLRYAKSCHLISMLPEVPPIAVRDTPVSVITKTEQAQIELFARHEGTPFTLGVLLCLYMGFRIGELCALQWGDVSWPNQTIHVGKTVSRVNTVGKAHKTELIISTPKTACSDRYIPIPDGFLLYLRARKKREDIYVVSGTKQCEGPRVFRRKFDDFLKRAGVKHYNVHTLRHTFASRCIEEGIDPKTVSELLGHANVQMTLNRYTHPSMEQKQNQINKLPVFGEVKTWVGRGQPRAEQ